MALGWAGSSTAVISGAFAPLYDRQRGLAISLALNGANAAGFTVAPALILLYSWYGLDRAVPEAAVVLLLVVLPLFAVGLRNAAVARVGDVPAPATGGSARCGQAVSSCAAPPRPPGSRSRRCRPCWRSGAARRPRQLLKRGEPYRSAPPGPLSREAWSVGRAGQNVGVGSVADGSGAPRSTLGLCFATSGHRLNRQSVERIIRRHRP